MADVSKLKARRTLGAPPSLTEASTNLTKPETPSEGREKFDGLQAASVPLAAVQSESRIDGRSMRRTNRVVQFATRVTPDFDQRVRALAMKEGLLIVEVLERALAAYERQREADS